MLGDYGATNVQGASSTCMCGFNSASTQSKWTGGSTWKGSGVSHRDALALTSDILFYIQSIKPPIAEASDRTAYSLSFSSPTTCFCLQYFPSFPATSPYVTSVGGTQGPDIGLTQEVRC